MMKKYFFLLLFFSRFLSAQTILTADDALHIGLKNNFDILIAKNQAEADSILNTFGEAGMLPTLSLNATTVFNDNDIHQKYSSGSEITKKNVSGNNINPGIALNWTIFDGTKMFVTKNKLDQIEMLGDFQFKAQVLNTTSELLLADAKRNLNTILARDVNTIYDVADSIPIVAIPDRTQMEQKMYAANPTLLAFKTQIEISNLAYKETKTQYYPRIGFLAAYNFNQTENAAGFTLLNQAAGFQTGLTFSMPLYQGGNLNHQVQVAKMNVATSQIQFDQASLQSSLQLQNAFSIYDTNLQELELEKQNETMARENMELALERLKEGQGTALDVSLAQSTLASALFRLSGFEY